MISSLAPTVVTGSCGSFDLGQCWHDITSAPGKIIHAIAGVPGEIANDAWSAICTSFADAFDAMLKEFAKAFVSFPDADLQSITPVYAVSMTLGAMIALILLFIQVGAVMWTRSGAPLAHALVGLAKAGLASAMTLSVAWYGMQASDELSNWIITANGNSIQDFSNGLATLFSWNGIGDALLLIFGLLGIFATVVLWFELLLRNAAIAITVATAPIAAAGQVGQNTQEWWRKLVRTGWQLLILKPVIALVFVVGFSMAGNASGITGVLTGMLVLILAVFAWPAVARFFTFTTVAMGGSMGVAALVGAGAGRAGSSGGSVDPAAFGGFSEGRAMAASAARGAGGSGTGAAGGGGGASGGGGGSAGGAAGPAVASALQGAQRALNFLAQRMEATAGHGGVEGAQPTAYPAGFPTGGPVRFPQRGAGSPAPTETEGPAAPSPPPPPPPTDAVPGGTGVI